MTLTKKELESRYGVTIDAKWAAVVAHDGTWWKQADGTWTNYELAGRPEPGPENVRSLEPKPPRHEAG